MKEQLLGRLRLFNHLLHPFLLHDALSKPLSIRWRYALRTRRSLTHMAETDAKSLFDHIQLSADG